MMVTSTNQAVRHAPDHTVECPPRAWALPALQLFRQCCWTHYTLLHFPMQGFLSISPAEKNWTTKLLVLILLLLHGRWSHTHQTEPNRHTIMIITIEMIHYRLIKMSNSNNPSVSGYNIYEYYYICEPDRHGSFWAQNGNRNKKPR